MTRGHPPLVAIDEAKRKAALGGSPILLVHADRRLPFDFIMYEGGCITLVRVYGGCGTPIMEFPISGSIVPARFWRCGISRFRKGFSVSCIYGARTVAGTGTSFFPQLLKFWKM
ncbi:hypothetical protein [Methanoregula sp.]|uniref:hypothetical protein n=1 Tax=Methanoregula sp. TaxID=2052170 RepID=UPI003C13BEE4